MVFKRFKYYSVIALLIVVMVIGIVFAPTVNVESDFQENIEGMPEIDIPIDEPDEQIEQAPVFKDAYKCWNYAYDIYANGKGVYCVLNSQGISSIGTQYVNSHFWRNGPVSNYSDNLKINYKKSESVFMENGCVIGYTDKNGDYHFAETTNCEYGSSFVIESEPTISNYAELIQVQPDNHDIIQIITKETSNLIYFNKAYSDYYELKIAMKPEKINMKYFYHVENNENLKEVVQDTMVMNITAKISKKTGYFL